MLEETCRRPNTHQYNFLSLKSGSAISSSVNLSMKSPTSLRTCFPVILQHFITCGVLFFFFLISFWHQTVRLKAKNVSISSLSSHAENNLSYPHLKPQVRFTLSRRPFLTHLIWLNPPPLCFHSTLASFCHGVHHSVLLFYVYLSLHRDPELLEVSGCMSSGVQEND